MKSATIGTVTSTGMTDIPGALTFPPWISKAAVGAFLAAAFTSTWGGFHLGPFQLADIFLIPTFGLVATMVLFGNLRFRIPWWLWAPAVGLSACIIVLKYHPVPDEYLAFRFNSQQVGDNGLILVEPGSVFKGAVWIVALLAVPIAAIACTALEPRAPKWTVACFLAGIAVSSLVALTDLTKLTHIARALAELHYNEDRQTGLTIHPNTLGLSCALAAPFAVYFIRESRHRWLPALALALICGGVVASGSRGAEVALPAALLAATVVSRPNMKGVRWMAATLAGAILASLAFVTLLAPGTLNKLFRFGGAGKISSSNEYRKQVSAQAWADFKHHPIFGIGIDHINEAHNIYLQIMEAGGCVLVVAMLIYWCGTLGSCWLATRNGEVLGRYLMISIIAWLVIGYLENQLTDRLLYYTVGCAAALAVTYRVQTPAGRVATAVGPARFQVAD